MSEPVIVSGMNFEMLAGQLQKTRKDILCVKDGHQLIIYTNPADIPLNLRREGRRRYEHVDVVQCSYRSRDDGSLFCFFSIAIDRWLSGGREGQLERDDDISKSSVVWPKGSVTQKKSDTPMDEGLKGKVIEIYLNTPITLIHRDIEISI
jgi:hypothetical protein